MRIQRGLAATIGVTALLASAASARPSNQTIDDYLNRLGDIVTLPASRTVINKGTPQSNGLGNDRWTCETDGVREQGSLLQIAAFGSRSDVIWPGSLIQGSSLISNQLAPIALPHGPETITVTAFEPGEGGGPAAKVQTASATVKHPSLDTVTEAVNNLVFSNPASHQPASMAMTSSDFYNAESGAVAIAASFSSLGTDISSYLKSQDYNKRSHVVVQFVQQYYTVAVAPPSHPAAFFAPGVSPDDVKSQTSQTSGPNPAVYINTVTYGRVAYIFLSSTERVERLKAAVDASFSGFLSSGRLSGSTDQQNIVRSADVQVFVVGGDAGSAAKLVARKLDGLNDWIKSGGTFARDNPGSAIAFSTRYLRADYRIAGANFVTDYSKPTCVQTPEKIVRVWRSYAIDDDKDHGNAQRFLVNLGSQLIAQEPWGGDDVTWRSSPPNYNGKPLAVTVPITDCPSLTFRTEQSGKNGKTTGRAWVYAATDAGRTFTLVDGQPFALDDNAGISYKTRCNIPQ